MSQKADRFKHIGEKILKRPETMESFLTDYQKPANNTMKMFFSHGATETDFYDPYRVLTSTFKFNVEQLTNGRFQVQSFPNNQLGGIVATLQQCERGLLEMTTSQNTSYVASWVPDVQVLDLPYLFPSLEVARKVLNGQFGQYLSDSIAEKCGLRVLAWLPTAMRNFGTNMEVKTPGDLKGKKIRTMGAPVYVELVKALGAAPTSIPWKELYTSLQTGVAEGHDQPPYVMRRFKFYEVNKYYLLDQHSLNVMGFYMSNAFYKSLSPEDQRIMRYAAREAQMAMLGVVIAAEGADLTFLANEGGMKVNILTPEAHKQFQEAVLPPLEAWMRTKVDPAVIDKLKKAVDDAIAELR